MVPVTCTTENSFVPYRNDLGIVKLPIRKQLSIDDKIISTKVTTGNAPNKMKVINYIVEDSYAISEGNSDEQGTINSLTAIRVPAGTKNSRPVGFLR